MTIDIIPDSFDKKLYNAKAAHPLQSWQWGEARKKMGTEVLRLGEWNGKSLMDVYQITLHKVPYTPFKIAYMPRTRYPSKAVLQYLLQYAKKHSIIFLKFEPNENKDSKTSDLRPNTSDLPIMKSPHQLFPDWTMVLNTTPTEEEILANMKQKTRYNIRLAQKKGVTVKEESTDSGFEKFSKLYFETTKRQRYYGHNNHYHKIVWETMREDIAHILISYFENTPLGAYELYYFNGVFYYPYGGSSMEHKNVMAPNLLMWEAIKLGKKLGATEFDMWGAQAPDTSGSSWDGFTRFKEGYGAQYVQKIGSFDLIANSMLYKLYTIVNKLRWTLLSLKKKLIG